MTAWLASPRTARWPRRVHRGTTLGLGLVVLLIGGSLPLTGIPTVGMGGAGARAGTAPVFTPTAGSTDPNVTLSAYEGYVSSSLNASGSGFVTASPLSLTFGPVPVSSCLSGGLSPNAAGNFYCVFSVPVLAAPGPYEVNATNGTAPDTGLANFTIESPTLGATPTSGQVGSSVSVTGVGYAAETPVTLSFGPTGITSCTSGSLTTGGSGNLACGFTVPAATAGVQTLLASDGTNSATASFAVLSNLTVAPALGAVGTDVVAVGTGFDGDASYSVSWNTTTTLCTGTTGGAGGLFCSLAPIPAAPGGDHSITASDGTNVVAADFDVLPALALSPAAGISGVQVGLIGTGLGATTSYFYCFLSLATSCSGGSPTFTSAANGSIPSGTRLTVPADSPGTYFVDVSPSPSGALAVDAAFALTNASLVLDPVSGPVGTVLGFSGSGYSPDTPYSYCFESTTSACGLGSPAFTSDGAGDIPTGQSITVPEDPDGIWYVVLSNDGVLVSAAAFTIESNFTLAPSDGVVGSTVVANGTGFDSGTPYAVFWNLTVTLCLGTTDSAGAFGCSFVVPSWPGSDVPVEAQQNSRIIAVVGFQVLPGAVVTPTSGPVGSTATLVGTGFASSTAGAVTSWNATTTLCSNLTDAQGSFSCVFTVPAAPAGPQNLTVSQLSVSVTTPFDVLPSLYLSPDSGPVGTSVSVVGSGFDPLSSFSVLWGGTLTLCSSTTSSVGAAACSFQVPSGPFGIVAVQVLEGTFSPEANFTIGAGITVTPIVGVIGTNATVTGTGFDPVSAYTVVWNGGLLLCSGVTNSSGNFTCPFTIPTGPGGVHPITALEGAHSASVVLTADPYVLLAASSGTVGTLVNVTGVGFGSAAPYSVLWNATTQLCSGTTTSIGGFTCTLVIPVAPGGLSNLTAQGSGLTANSSLTVMASILLDPTSGSVGTIVNATGYGFGASAPYSLTWSASTTLCTGTTNSNGVFSCTFAVPASAAGSFTITATGASSSPTGTFAVNSTASGNVLSGLHLAWWEEVAGVVAIALVVVVTVVLIARRRTAREGTGATRARSGSNQPDPNVRDPGVDLDTLMARLEQMSLEVSDRPPEPPPQPPEGAYRPPRPVPRKPGSP